MTTDSEPDPRVAHVDTALEAWRQGDCVVGEQWFVHRFDPSLPVSEAGRKAADQDVDLAEQSSRGLAVLTQTCDILRSCKDRPFVEVCPLVEVDDTRLNEIRRGRRPGYAYVPGLAAQRLVADLDRVMTVEKPVIAHWERTPGWTTDAEARGFAQALARKRTRFAFPDDFSGLIKKFHGRLTDKHDRNSDEGRGLRALREIRVQATPSWEASSVDLFLWFIREDSPGEFTEQRWAELQEAWIKLITSTGRFKSVLGQLVRLEDMTAADYVDSDPLDLDHLSRSAT